MEIVISLIEILIRKAITDGMDREKHKGVVICIFFYWGRK